MKRFIYSKIEWDDDNVYKNEAKHGVKYYEIEEAIENNPKCIIPHKKYNDRYLLFGRSDAGRYLFIIYQDKGGGIIRPIHGKDMEDHHKDFFLRNRRYYDHDKKK
ncbi:MAG: BrnT family toxin [Candidatus Hydrogenedentota bacterium]